MRRLFCIVLMMINLTAFAQWECSSRLGAGLKPIGTSKFMWGAELTASGGWIHGDLAGNLMAYLGLNYTIGKNNFYVEGGGKAWLRGTPKLDEDNGTYSFKGNLLPGLREAWYKFDGKVNELTIGLQPVTGDESYLVNERMIGLKYVLHTHQIKFNVTGGTVMQDFARNGRFCTLGYLYNDVVAGRPRSLIGYKFGETDFAMVSLAYIPEKKSDDEFGDAGSKVFSFDKVGAVGYGEFGKLIPQLVIQSGLYAQMTLAGIEIKPEVLLQTVKKNIAFIYCLSLDKKFQWTKPQVTRLYAQYIGYVGLSDSLSRPINSFSNLFMGDALRLDVADAPLVIVGVKHSFNSIKLSIKVQGAMQTKASVVGGDYGFMQDYYTSPLFPMKELDFAVAKNFGKHLWLSGTFGLLHYPSLEHTGNYLHYNNIQTFFGKLECRILL